MSNCKDARYRRYPGVSGQRGKRYPPSATAIEERGDGIVSAGFRDAHAVRQQIRKEASTTAHASSAKRGRLPFSRVGRPVASRARARAFYTGKVCAERPQPRGISVSAFSVARWGGFVGCCGRVKHPYCAVKVLNIGAQREARLSWDGESSKSAFSETKL